MKFARSIGEFSEDELREYACEHVLYEITHFIRAARPAVVSALRKKSTI